MACVASSSSSSSSSSSTTTTTTGEKKIVRLMCSDGAVFEVKESVAVQSRTICHMIEDECADSVIPLSLVKGDVLSKILEFCQKYAESSSWSGEDIKTWEAEFMKVDQLMLYELLVGANYLEIPKLLDLACQTVADMIKGKSVDEIRRTFNIKNDFTPQEEEAIRKENPWVFD